ncbi:hypothetical protein D3C73_1308000 [compost metagenome]
MRGQGYRTGAMGQHDVSAHADVRRLRDFSADHRVIQVVERLALCECQRMPCAMPVMFKVSGSGADHPIAPPGIAQ